MKKSIVYKLSIVVTFVLFICPLMAENPVWNAIGHELYVTPVIACNNNGAWIYEEELGSTTDVTMSFVVLTEAEGRDVNLIPSTEKEVLPNNCGSAVAVDDIDFLYIKPLPDDSEIMGTVAFKHATFDGTWQFEANVRFSIPHQIAKLVPVYDSNGKKIGGTVYNYRVTQIADEVIHGWNKVNRLVLPHTLEYVPDNSSLWFENTDTVFVYSKSIKSESSFLPHNLRSIVFKDGVEKIPDYFCAYAHQLDSVRIPNSVTSIGEFTFEGCNSLPIIDNIRYADTYLIEAVDKTKTSYNIKDGTRWIGNHAFSECSSLTSIKIPNSVTSIGELAFYRCEDLSTLIIGNSVTIIGNFAFSFCKNLTNIELNDGITYIGDCAFSSCYGLTSINIPRTVSYIGEGPFYNCAILSNISIAQDNLNYCIEEDVLFTKDKKKLIQVFGGCQRKEYIIPEGVTSIGDYAFGACPCIESVIIPNGVTSIGNFAFDSRFLLRWIHLPKTVSYIGGWAFSNCHNITYISCSAPIPPSLGERVFYDISRSIPLYVPAQSIENYKTAEQWKEFMIEAIKEKPTAINQITEPSQNSSKVLNDGQIYILRDDKTYTIMGEKVK